MAVNAYSKGPSGPAFQNNYVSQYIPLPIEEIQQALYSKQLTQNQQLALGQELVETSQGWKVDPVDAPYIQQAQQVIEQQVGQLSQQDLTQRDNQEKLQQLLKAAQGDKVIQQALSTGKYRAAFQEQIAKLGADGRLHDNNAIHEQNAYKAYVDAGGAAGGATYGEFTLAPHVDARKTADAYFSSIQASGGEQAARIAAEDGSSIYYSNGSVGVSPGKISQTHAAAITDWLSTPDARQTMNDYLATHQDSKKSAGQLKQEAAQYAVRFLYDRGMSHAYSKTTSNLASALDKKEDLKRKKKEEAALTWMDGGEFGTSMGDRPEFDASGKASSKTDVGFFGGMALGWELGGKLPDSGSGWGWLNKLGMALDVGMAEAGENFFIGEGSPYAEAFFGREVSKLQEGTKAANTVRQSLGLPAVTDEDMFNRLDKKTPTVIPQFTGKGAATARAQAQDQIVNSGYFATSTLYDPEGRQLLAKDVVKEDDVVSVESAVGPGISWQTPYTYDGVKIVVKGKDNSNPRTYILDKSSYLDRLPAPRNAEEAKLMNARAQSLVKYHGSHTFVQWDPRTLQGVKKQGVYDPEAAQKLAEQTKQPNHDGIITW